MGDYKLKFSEDQPEDKSNIKNPAEKYFNSRLIVLVILYLSIFILLPIAISRYPIAHPLTNSGPNTSGMTLEGRSWIDTFYLVGLSPAMTPLPFIPLPTFVIFIYPAFALAKITISIIEKRREKIGYLFLRSILFFILALIAGNAFIWLALGKFSFLLSGKLVYFLFELSAIMQYIIVYALGVTFAFFSRDTRSLIKFKIAPLIIFLTLVIFSSYFLGPLGSCSRTHNSCVADRAIKLKNGNLCDYAGRPNECYVIFASRGKNEALCQGLENSYYKEKCMCSIDNTCPSWWWTMGLEPQIPPILAADPYYKREKTLLPAKYKTVLPLDGYKEADESATNQRDHDQDFIAVYFLNEKEPVKQTGGITFQRYIFDAKAYFDNKIELHKATYNVNFEKIDICGIQGDFAYSLYESKRKEQGLSDSAELIYSDPDKLILYKIEGRVNANKHVFPDYRLDYDQTHKQLKEDIIKLARQYCEYYAK